MALSIMLLGTSLIAVDFTTLNYEARCAGILGAICGVVGLAIGCLVKRRQMLAGAIGAAIGVIAGVVCAQLYGTNYLITFLVVGVLCSTGSAYKASADTTP